MKYMCNGTLEVRDIVKILWKRGEIAPAISPLFHNIFYMLLDFHVKAGTRFSLRDKRLFEISEVEITRVNCTSTIYMQNTISTSQLLFFILYTSDVRIRTGGVSSQPANSQNQNIYLGCRVRRGGGGGGDCKVSSCGERIL